MTVKLKFLMENFMKIEQVEAYSGKLCVKLWSVNYTATKIFVFPEKEFFAASVPISTLIFIYSRDRSTYFPATE
jgi:hypothetical protein